MTRYINAFLEVRENIASEDLKVFIKPFKFNIMNDPIPQVDSKTIVFPIKGPEMKYKELKEAIERHEKYMLWPESSMNIFL